MAVEKMYVMALSEESWEDAAQVAVSSTAKTVDNIRSIQISDMEAKVEDDEIREYRISGLIVYETG
jgi:hypothetical protein